MPDSLTAQAFENVQIPVFSRRGLFRIGGIAAVELLSHSANLLGQGEPKQKLRRVIVVGAGFSGLACAYELNSAGYEVTVFDSRNRVGGRVSSLTNLIPGKVVEAGGELLGSNHPHVVAYATRFGFDFLDVVDDEAPSPTILEGKLTLRTRQNAERNEVRGAYRQMTEDARSIDAVQPWLSPQAEQLDRISTAEWLERLKLSEFAHQLLTLRFTSSNGVATSRQSYLGNLAQVKGGGLEKYWTDSEVFRLKGGNQQFALRFARELGDDRLKLNCPITEILATDRGVRVVDFAGRKHEADDLVLAIPPSTWSTIRFDPALPKELVVQMGANVKYLAVVKSPVWRESHRSPDGHTDGMIGSTWHGTSGQPGEGPEALIAFSGGPAADAIHRLPIAERESAYLTAYEALYPGFRAQFLKGISADWIGEPWTRAGYSFPAPGEIMTVGPQLRSGIGRLHFAGEHTCYPFIGYMEGALNSGASLAKRLAVRDGLTP
jgi:monoamine oxidase